MVLVRIETRADPTDSLAVLVDSALALDAAAAQATVRFLAWCRLHEAGDWGSDAADRPFLTFALLLLCPTPALAEDLVSGISQDIIQITSNYTGTDIVVFGAIEQAQNPQGRDIVVVVRGPDEPMTVRRRERIAGVWVNNDAARFEGLPAYYYLASTEPIARIAPREALVRYGIGLQALRPSVTGSHHDPEPFRQAAIRYHQRAGLYAESPGSIDFLSETLFRTRVREFA